MGASRHQPQQIPTRLADGLANLGSSFRCRQNAVHVQPQGLFEQQADRGGTVHAVTTPRVKALQLFLGQPYMGWMGEAHGAGRDTCQA